MSTYSESTGFWLNNRHSSEFGIINASTSSGLFEESFLPKRSIVEEKTFGRPEAYFMGFEYEAQSIPLTLYFDEGWDDYRLHEVVNWLVTPSYVPLVFDIDTSRIFYVTYEGDPRILHNGCKMGYVNINFRCNSPFSFTPVEENEFTFANNSLGTNIDLYNIGHMDCFPTVKIEKTGTGNISIINLTDGNIESKMTGLADLEVVTIDGDNEDITTSLPNTYRYNNFNNNFLKIVPGINTLKITGNAKITFTYQSKRYI